jgi:hypothetical protein
MAHIGHYSPAEETGAGRICLALAAARAPEHFKEKKTPEGLCARPERN